MCVTDQRALSSSVCPLSFIFRIPFVRHCSPQWPSWANWAGMKKKRMTLKRTVTRKRRRRGAVQSCRSFDNNNGNNNKSINNNSGSGTESKRAHIYRKSSFECQSHTIQFDIVLPGVLLALTSCMNSVAVRCSNDDCPARDMNQTPASKLVNQKPLVPKLTFSRSHHMRIYFKLL